MVFDDEKAFANFNTLSELEEAILISAIGLTGNSLPDRPFESPTGQKILGTPNLNFPGRAAGSTDNAQATHFFLINDSGVYYLKRLDGVDLKLRRAAAPVLASPAR